MAEPRALPLAPEPPATGQPWTQRLIAATPVSPAWVGLGIALAQFGFFLAYHAVLAPYSAVGVQHLEFWGTHAGPQMIMALLIGYGPTAMAYSRRASLGILEQLRGIMHCSAAEFEALRQEIGAFPRKPLRWVGGLCALAILPAIWIDTSMIEMRKGFQLVDEIWLIYANAMTGWMVGRAVGQEVAIGRIFSRIGEQLTEVDLFDLHALDPFARRGLQSVLLWIVGLSIFSGLFVGGWASNFAPGVAVCLAAVACAALLLPVLGVHRRIRAAKRTELARLHEALRRDRNAILDPEAQGAHDAAARLPGLVALRQQVASLREWPFDVSTLVRFSFYISIGLGSWLGAAVVERLLDAALR